MYVAYTLPNKGAGGASQYQYSSSKRVKVKFCGRLPSFNESYPDTKIHVYWYYGY